MSQFNDGIHIEKIIGIQPCDKHLAPHGIPCFHMPRGNGNGYYPAICNQRAVAAGKNGKISESSYQTKQKQQRRHYANRG